MAVGLSVEVLLLVVHIHFIARYADLGCPDGEVYESVSEILKSSVGGTHTIPLIQSPVHSFYTKAEHTHTHTHKHTN